MKKRKPIFSTIGIDRYADVIRQKIQSTVTDKINPQIDLSIQIVPNLLSYKINTDARAD